MLPRIGSASATRLLGLLERLLERLEGVEVLVAPARHGRMEHHRAGILVGSAPASRTRPHRCPASGAAGRRPVHVVALRAAARNFLISAGSVDGGFVCTPAMPILWQCSIRSNGWPPPRPAREREPNALGVPPILGGPDAANAAVEDKGVMALQTGAAPAIASTSLLVSMVSSFPCQGVGRRGYPSSARLRNPRGRSRFELRRTEFGIVLEARALQLGKHGLPTDGPRPVHVRLIPGQAAAYAWLSDFEGHSYGIYNRQEAPQT